MTRTAVLFEMAVYRRQVARTREPLPCGEWFRPDIPEHGDPGDQQDGSDACKS